MFDVWIHTMDVMAQDRFVRAAIASDELLTKEHVLRKKLLEFQSSIPKLCNFPFVVDVEYLCFEKEEGKYRIKPGQGDLLFTDGNGAYVAVEIKSSYVCFNGSDRVQITKTTKLIEQVHFYQEYQRGILGADVKVHGCGVTEQKIYWMDHDGHLEQYWWACGPDELPTREASVDVDSLQSFEDGMDIEDIPEEYQEIHSMFMDEVISKHYTSLQCYGNGRMVYLSRCKHKRITVCKEHVGQKELDEIKQRDRQDGFRHGQILMFGQIRPTLMSF
jgi:Holliday junction resolvase-like predicted endonuclease